MTIPPQLESLIICLNEIGWEIQKSYQRDLAEATGKPGRFWNWEAGLVPITNIFPGASIEFARYTIGGLEEGWLLHVRYTDGKEAMECVIDNGNGGFTHDWAEAEI